MSYFKQLASKFPNMTEEEEKEYRRIRKASNLGICHRCNGEGTVSGEVCPRCDGVGFAHVVYIVEFDRARWAYVVKIIDVSNAEYKEIVEEISRGDHRHNFGDNEQPDYADTYLSFEEAQQRKAELNMKEVV